MIEIRKVQTIDGRRIDRIVKSDNMQVIEAEHLVMFPALIDPHVHFRVPGAEHKETWESAARAAIAGGVTTVFDMPNNSPSCVSKKRLEEKMQRIDEQLKSSGIPLRYYLYLGADQNHLDEIAKVKEKIIGLKIYMGSSTGDLLMDRLPALEKAFQIAGENGVIVAVHAEDEERIAERKKQFAGEKDPAVHSKIRNPEVATSALDLAIQLAEKHGARLYVAHVSTREELALIRAAKKRGAAVYAEVTPHHLFLNEADYKRLGTFALVNPPLRTKADNAALFEAIHEETIDTVGTDHAPHTREEKQAPYGSAPSGFPSIELYFALLLNAHHEGKLSLEEIVSLTHTRPQEIFKLPPNDDIVLVDMNKKRTIDDSHLRTKAKWSPYAGKTVTGWPRYVILKGKIYDLEKL